MLMSSMTQESFIPNKGEDVPGCAVLIFSTDRTFIEHYRVLFRSLGFSPVTVTTPEAALAILRLMVVALVVVDFEDGPFDSRQILEGARSTQYYAPVLVIGRKSDQDFREQALALGAADYLDHPAHPDDIIHALLPSHAGARTTARGAN